MGQQLFILTDGAVPGNGTDIDAIADGKAGFVVEGTTVTKAAIDMDDKLQLIAKRADGSPEVSPVFSPENVIKASKIDPSAGTPQFTTVDIAIPATQSTGDEWLVKIIDTTVGTRAPKHYNFSAYHLGVDLTPETVTNAIRDAINANTELPVTAVNNADVLELTADNTIFTFRVAVDNNAEFSVIDYDTANVPAAGTPELIGHLEDYLQSFGRGITNQTSVPIKKPLSQVDSTADYTLYVFEMLIPTPDYAGKATARTASYKMYIAESDDTNIGAGTNHVGFVLYDLVT